MENNPTFKDLFQGHIKLFALSVAAVVTVIAATRLVPNLAPYQLERFVTAPLELSWLGVVAVWGLFVSALQVSMLGKMIEYDWGSDDVYRHLMARADPNFGVFEGAAERMLAKRLMSDSMIAVSFVVLTLGSIMAFCAYLHHLQVIGLDGHANTLIVGAILSTVVFTVMRAGSLMNGVSNICFSLLLFWTAIEKGLASTIVLLVAFDAVQALVWYLGKRLYWVFRRVHEQKLMGKSRLALIVQWLTRLAIALKLKKAPLSPAQVFIAQMIAQAKERQRHSGCHSHENGSDD